MSLVPKRFCFCCKKASEELEAENKTLKFCNDCQIAQYVEETFYFSDISTVYLDQVQNNHFGPGGNVDNEFQGV